MLVRLCASPFDVTQHGDCGDEIDKRIEQRNIKEIWPPGDKAHHHDEQHRLAADLVHRQDSVIYGGSGKSTGERQDHGGNQGGGGGEEHHAPSPDGLDGLATLPVVLVAAALGVFAYVSGHHEFAHYLMMPALPGVGEVVVVAAALVGAGLGFLWFNTYPALVFMGDVGSLSMGAALGILAVVVRQELLLGIMGGVFVAETVSVMLQVVSFRLRKKRVFRMAPLHHHFELKGWPEPRVIVRFWLITLVLVLMGLATLKVR